ncbi:hypothetical protein AAC387_Pa11g1880 [Persea americana]
MANSKGTTNIRNSSCAGKQSLLPPKGPFRCTTPSNVDYGSSSIGSRAIPKTIGVHRHHQCTSSEIFLVEEQFPWLNDLLNEPETSVRRGTHRRSSSDSFAYLEASSSSSNISNTAEEDYKQRSLASASSWGSLDFDHSKDVHSSSFYTENSFGRQQNIGWESSLKSMPYLSRHPSPNDNILFESSGSSCTQAEPDAVPSSTTKKQYQDKSGQHDQEIDRSDCSYSKPSAPETDSKRARQKFAQRSRVRKLQYIAELERTVQALQAEGSEVLAQLDFMGQQNLILNMENKALKQRVDSLAQEQLVKYLEQGVLEKEIARLQATLHQQQHQNQRQHPPSIYHRCSRGGLHSQFASLSLKHEESNSARESVGGPLQTSI